MEWIIVTDSGCDLLPGELAPNVHLRRVPLSILLGRRGMGGRRGHGP